MKYFFFLFFLTSLLFAQQIKIIEHKAVTSKEEGEFYYPQIQKNKIVFTSQNYKGLWVKDTDSKKILNISESAGAGYNPIIKNNAETIYFRTDTYEKGKKVSDLIAYNFKNSSQQTVEKKLTELNLLKSLNNQGYIHSRNCEKYSFSKFVALQNETNSELILLVEDSKIILFRSGVKNELQPLGKAHYIWPSLSPQGDKILFTCAGKGTFISDLEGNILTKLGYANYPAWSSNGEWIVCMNDKDDGTKVISSDIEIIKADGSYRTKLTDTKDVKEMYPSWNSEQNEIVYNTEDGIIYIIKLEIK